MGLLGRGPAVVAHTVSLLFPQRERQAQREDALELTEKLDQDWKEIQTLLAHKTPKSDNKDKKEKPKVGVELVDLSLGRGGGRRLLWPVPDISNCFLFSWFLRPPVGRNFPT